MEAQAPEKTEEKKPSVRISIIDNVAQINYLTTETDPYGYGSTSKAKPVNVVKTVKLESLVKAFQNAETKIASPILPLNCIRYEEKGNSVVVILYYPQTPFTATCLGKVYENCMRPGLIMKYTLSVQDKSGVKFYSIANSSCFGVIDDAMLINENTQLYGLPFPNIGSGGWICWGSNSVSGQFKSLTGLRVYVDRLFKSPFNDHLFNTSFLRTFGINNPHDLFKYIQEKPAFPNEILENLGRRYTLGTI